MMRSSMLFVMLVSLFGCNTGQQIPAVGPIGKITATLHEVPAMNLDGIPRVTVPEDQTKSFGKLITPTSPCSLEISDDLNYHVADVVIEHPDGTKTSLMVRYTGFNPAAISLDGKKYFFGGTDGAPDGAIRIVRLLREYDFKSKSGSNSEPAGK